MQADGRTVAYPSRASTPAGDWLRKNPRSHPLGQLRLLDRSAAGGTIALSDIGNPVQTLDLWSGEIRSRYEVDGKPVEVSTVCHPDLDLVAVRMSSPHLAHGRLGVELAFPRGHDLAQKLTPALDWTWTGRASHHPGQQGPGYADLERQVGDTGYAVKVQWEGAATFTPAGPTSF